MYYFYILIKFIFLDYVKLIVCLNKCVDELNVNFKIFCCLFIVILFFSLLLIINFFKFLKSCLVFLIGDINVDLLLIVKLLILLLLVEYRVVLYVIVLVVVNF